MIFSQKTLFSWTCVNLCFKGRYWLGARDCPEKGIWRWETDGTIAGNYSTTFGGLQIQAGGIDNYGGTEYCGAIEAGEFIDYGCGLTTKALCECPRAFSSSSGFAILSISARRNFSGGERGPPKECL